MEEAELKYWVKLAAVPGIGPARFKKVVNYFASAADFFTANLSELLAAGLDPKVAEEAMAGRAAVDIERSWAILQKEKIKIVTFLDDDFPPLLKQITDYPPFLYYKGERSVLAGNCWGVVGTRRPTNYGLMVTNQVTKKLVSAGMTVVSGLALGIDGEAHRATLASGGITVAVLGCGVDRASIYPATHRQLAEQIIQGGGAVISEFPCGAEAMPQNFPQRNRLISGLSVGLIVTEAAKKSGALITAFFALDQNREVWAVPGDINRPLSVGPNFLIAAGARPLIDVNDIIAETDLTLTKENVTLPLAFPASPIEEKIYQILAGVPKPIDEIILLSQLSSAEVNASLVLMEVNGLVKNLGGQIYSRL